MQLLELLSQLQQAGIRLVANEDKLQVKAPKGALTKEFGSHIKQHKSEILAFLAQQTAFTQKAKNAPIIPRKDHNGPLPLSYSQRRLWLVDKIQGGSADYNMPVTLQITGQWQTDVLEQVFQALLERHEILRTVYSESEGEPVQRVRPVSQCQFRLKYHDLSGLAPEAQKAQLAQLKHSEITTTFDLQTDLMLRVTLYQLADHRAQLLVNIHHIASDGWSMEILNKEFISLYGAFAENGAVNANSVPTLAPMQIQYADFALWQTRQGAESSEKQLSYWKKQLADLPQEHSLPRCPFKGDNSSDNSNSSGNLTGSLPAKIAGPLVALTHSQQISPFMLGHAALALVLARHSGSTDVVVGTAVAGRERKELDGLIGFFVNTLVLRVNTHQDNMADLLQHVKQVHLQAQSNQSLPFDQLVEELGASRDSVSNPLFQIMLSTNTSFNDAATNSEASSGLGSQASFSTAEPSAKAHSTNPQSQHNRLHIEKLNSDMSIAKFDLDVCINIHTTGIEINWQYDTCVFAPEMIQQLQEHLCHLLQNISQGKDVLNCPVESMSCMPDAERQILLQDFVGTRKLYPLGKCLHQLFEEQVNLTPNHTALIFNDHSLSYGALNALSNRLARAIRQRVPEVSAGSDQSTASPLVGLYLERSDSTIIAILAILKAGCAFVPVSPDSPNARVQQIMQDSNMCMLLTKRSHENVLSELANNAATDMPILALEEVLAETHADTNLQIPMDHNHLAYVIYTSGTTGLPKGVMVEHHTVVNLYYHNLEFFDIGTDETFYTVTSYTFDPFVAQFCLALFTGNRMVIASDAQIADPQLLQAQAKHYQSTSIHATPTLLLLLQLDKVTTLRRVISGGEAASSQLMDLYGDRLINSYGPTETTVTSHQHVCRQLGDGARLPIGRGTANTLSYVLDANQQLVPRGAVGELYIGGAQVSRGYLNQPELTASRFVNNPFASTHDKIMGFDRMYKTGDLVRWTGNGVLEFLGRDDDQIKIRGFRIELGEVASQISQVTCVDSAVVQVSGHGDNVRLVAYIKPAADECVMESSNWLQALRRELQQRLLPYMVPSAFVIVEQWRTNANGKLDLNDCPAPDFSQFQQDYQAASNETEHQLVSIWSKLLAIPDDKLGINSDFFELGGHSLLAIKLLNRVRESFATDISLANFFKTPTISELARVILTGEAHEELTADGLPASDTDSSIIRGSDTLLQPQVQDNTLPQPLSFGQKRLWMVQQMDLNSIQYSMPASFGLAAVNVGKLAEAFKLVVQRHHILRTVYFEKEGQAWQQVQPAPEQVLRIEDISHLSAPQRQAALQQLNNDNASTPFDLSKDLMLRPVLVRLSEGQYQLLFNMHHIASDGVSLQILMQELQQAYGQLLQDKATALPPLAFQYIDFVAWQRDKLTPSLREKEIQYWRQQLADIPPVHSLPLLLNQHANAPTQGKLLRQHLAFATSCSLENHCQQAKITPLVFMYSAFALLLNKFSNGNDIVVGTPISERRHQAFEPLMGLFVNNLTLRSKVPGEGSLLNFLQASQQMVLDAFEHSWTPFEQLVDELNTPRVTGCHPLFQILFTWENQPGSDASAPAHASPSTETELSESMNLAVETELVPLKLDLEVTFTRRKHGVDVTWNYNRHLFPDWLIQLMADGLNVLVQDMLSQGATVDRPLAQLRFLKHDLEQQLLQHAAEPCDISWQQERIEQRFKAQAALHPEKTAIRCNDKRYSYADVNALSNGLALSLRHHAVSDKPVVAICLERDMPWPLAMLAVLKMGGTYVPIDPKYPQDRIHYILQDSQAELLLTQQQLVDNISPADNANASGVKTSADDTACTTLLMDQSGIMQPAGSEALEGIKAWQNPMAYMIYTSGTTGHPKGTMVNQGGLCSMAQYAKGRYDITSNSKYLQALSFGFDAAGFDWLNALLNGAELIIADSQSCADPQTLGEMIVTHKVTHFCHVPTFAFKVPQTALRQLRVIMMGGEALDINMARKLAEHCKVFNVYGPTENSIASTDKQVMPDDTLMTIGKPITNTWYLVLDEFLNLVPPGVIGELYLGGVGLAQGYLGKPEQTQKAFLTNPFSDDAQSRLYKTGDRVRRLDNGELEFVGRVDSQIKIRGYRVELSEIEEQLERLPEVKDCKVMVTGEGDSKNLMAFVVPAKELSDESQYLQGIARQLRQVLPAHMVPAWCQLLNELPTTTNGKVDTKILSKLVHKTDSQKDYVAPATELERRLQQICGVTLDLHKPSVSRHFFELGGHSFLAIQLVMAIREQLQVALSVTDVFQHPSITELARFIETAIETDGEGSVQSERSNQKAPRSGIKNLVTLHHQANNTEKTTQTEETHHTEETTQTEKADFTLVCVPGVLGLSNQFRPLAEALSCHADAPGCHAEVLALDYPGLLDPQQLQQDIPQICRDFIESLTQAGLTVDNRQTPLVLLGHSFGGVIALEMAKTLAAQGQDIKVVLLDTHLNSESEGHVARFDFDSEKAIVQLTDALQSASKHNANSALMKSITDNISTLFNTQKCLSDNYVLSDSDVELLYIYAHDSAPVLQTSGQFNQMQSLLKNLEVTSVVGNHMSMLETAGSHAIARHLSDFVKSDVAKSDTLKGSNQPDIALPHESNDRVAIPD